MYLIIDLEATCWERGHPLYGQNEIIEIGGVVLNGDYQILGEAQRFVRPVRHPILSEFCKKLTSITQADVDGAQYFPYALDDFRRQTEGISGQKVSELVFCSWGNYDRNQLTKDCRHHRIPYPFGVHRNLRTEFAARRGIKRVGVDRALRMLGIPMEGTHHRGIDDARNIAKIFRHESP
jgi:inhibitor of KinA sporulation pathway (predicted exonuclease)